MDKIHSMFFITSDGYRLKVDLGSSHPRVRTDTEADADANRRGFVELEWQTDTGKCISYKPPLNHSQRNQFTALPTKNLRYMFIVSKDYSEKKSSIAKILSHDGVEVFTITPPERLTPDQYNGRSRKLIGEHDTLGDVVSFCWDKDDEHLMLVFLDLARNIVLKADGLIRKKWNLIKRAEALKTGLK